MHLLHLFLLGAATLGVSLNASADTHAASSFGPEISAEDFDQHVQALSILSAGQQRRAYLLQQFSRLGLPLQTMACPAGSDGLRATLASHGEHTASTVYFADINDTFQLAGVLELAERFMTYTPRPTHDVHFIFSGSALEALKPCQPVKDATPAIRANGMEILDRSSLVRALNALQQQGR